MLKDKDRWKLIGFNVGNGSFVVQDNLLNKQRSYHVPMLTNAIVIDRFAYILTLTRKIMRVDLPTAKRQFITPDTIETAEIQAMFAGPKL